MAFRQCVICNKEIRAGDELEHLRTNHLGPHYFWFDACEYRTEEPSMTGSEIVKMCRGASTVGYDLVEDRDGKWIYRSGGEAIDLTRRPHFWFVPYATIQKGP